MKKLIRTVFGICAIVSAHAQNNGVDVDSVNTKDNEASIIRPKRVNMNSPLYFVDKEEITAEELAKIKADDIALIEVLKDSASTYMYGERGRYGVILIELKYKRKTNLRKSSSE